MADYGVRITLSADSPVPSYNVAPWVSGVASLSSGAVNVGWTAGRLISVSPVGEQADIAQGGNYAEVSEFRAVIDANGYPAFLAAGASLLGAVVEVGTLAGGVLTERFRGVVSDLSWEGAELDIQVESITTLRHLDLPARILTAQEFPGTPTASEGAVVPIVYGAVERMTGVPLLSDQDYLTPLTVNGEAGLFLQTATFLAIGSGVPAASSTFAPLAIAVAYSGYSYEWPSENTEAGPRHLLEALIASEPCYLEIVDGTGSGQQRLISFPAPSGRGSLTYTDLSIDWMGVTLAAPWDTVPDATSRFRAYAQVTGAVVVVADEATVSGVTAEVGGTQYPIASAQSTLAAGIITADVSAEFRRGEDYAAIAYHYPVEVRDVEALRDGFTAAGGISRGVLGYTGTQTFDTFGYAEFDVSPMCAGLGNDNPEVYAFVSASTAAGSLRLWISAIRWDGTEDIVDPSITLSSANNFPASVLPDGVAGAFGIAPIGGDILPRPLEQYRKIRLALFVVPTVPPTVSTLGASTWTQGATSVTISGYTPIVGEIIRPIVPYGQGQSIQVSTRAGCDWRLWREIASFVESPAGVFTCELVNTFGGPDEIEVPTGSYQSVIGTYSDLSGITETEIGVGIVYGAIPQESTFYVSTASGRTFGAHWPALPVGVSNGDPITQARDMALDILYRDLGLVAAQVDFDAFQALPDGIISAAIVEQEDSRALLARLAREWNWVLGHDLQGRETATAWLESMHSLTSDYSVANADIVSGTLVGIDQTALEDIVTMPDMSWSWTEADGFRSSGTVTDVSTPPASLNASNYLQYITGLGDFATALDAYTILHEAWKRSIVMRRGAVEYRTGGDPLSLYYGRRLEWAASRKDLLDLRVNEGHAAASAHVGQRVDVTHRRYTGGGTVYGTVVGRWWHPEDGQAQLLVMLDYVPFVGGTGLYVDTLDGTSTQYIDQIDGTSPEYIDTLGGA